MSDVDVACVECGDEAMQFFDGKAYCDSCLDDSLMMDFEKEGAERRDYR